jgi:outer membrane protein
MLKNLKLVVVTVLFSLLGSNALATDKIGYVNLMAVLEGTSEGKATVAQLKKDVSAKQAKFNKRMQALGEKIKQFKSRANMLKADIKEKQAMELQKEEQELKMMGSQLQAELQRKQAEALTQFQSKVRGVIETVARREGIGFVIRQEALVFGPPKMDLTNQIIREYDKRFTRKKAKKGK